MRASKVFKKFFLITLLLLGAATRVAQAQKNGASAPAPGAGQGGGGTAFFESQMLAYGALNQVSESAVKAVCDAVAQDKTKNDATVIIFDQTSFQGLQAWQSFVVSLNALNEAYKTLLCDEKACPSDKDANAGSASFITGGADLASLITAVAASTAENASGFAISNTSMAVSLVHQFKRLAASRSSCKNLNVVYFPLFGSFTFLPNAQAAISEALAGPNQTRRMLQTAMPSPFHDNQSPKYLLFTDLNNSYDALLKSLLPGAPSNNQGAGNNQSAGATPSGGPTGSSSSSSTSGSQSSGSFGSTSLLQGAVLQKLIEQPNTYILYADVAAAGGTQRARKNLFTVLFTGDLLSYSGGVIVNVALLKACDETTDRAKGARDLFQDLNKSRQPNNNAGNGGNGGNGNSGTPNKSCEARLMLADTVRYRTDFTLLGVPGQSETVERTDSGDNVNSLCNRETSRRGSRAEVCP
jgi:hypothetical protein